MRTLLENLFVSDIVIFVSIENVFVILPPQFSRLFFFFIFTLIEQRRRQLEETIAWIPHV